MEKSARIATWAFGASPGVHGQTQEQMIDFTLERVRDAAGTAPDLICLPEALLDCGGDRRNPRWAENNARVLEGLQDLAKAHHCHISASLHEPSPTYAGKRYNTNFLIGRDGEVMGGYRKIHITEGEHNNGTLPGDGTLPIFDTDIGRIGMMTCFDIGWREEWARLERLGAQIVIWSSAYEGGNLLNAYAATHMYYVVSSVRSCLAQIIDPTGRLVCKSSLWHGLAVADIDPGLEIFHIDRQSEKLNHIRRVLGSSVVIQSHSNENVFTIASRDPAWPMRRICEEFGLMSYKAYHQEATALQEADRRAYPEK